MFYIPVQLFLYRLIAMAIIMDKDNVVVGYYSNGHVLDLEKNVIGYYANGYIYDTRHEVIGNYVNGYIKNLKLK